MFILLKLSIISSIRHNNKVIQSYFQLTVQIKFTASTESDM